jgi:hypothetical protein
MTGADSSAGGGSRVGAGSVAVLDSCAGADSCAGGDSRAGAGSRAGSGSGAVVASCAGAWDSGEEVGSLVACGACAGGCSGLVVDVLEAPPGCTPERFAWLPEAALAVLPGNACAAASANTPVRTTLPATSQRLIR